VKTHRSSVLSATAVALMVLCGTASAAGLCSNQTLKGPYGFSAKGEALGILDSANVLHAFPTPAPLDDVAIVTFNGAGSFSRTDFGNVSGVPKGGQTAFNPNQNGRYTLNSDCTGNTTTMASCWFCRWSWIVMRAKSERLSAPNTCRERGRPQMARPARPGVMRVCRSASKGRGCSSTASVD
jgi:hypothetical protein